MIPRNGSPREAGQEERRGLMAQPVLHTKLNQKPCSRRPNQYTGYLLRGAADKYTVQGFGFAHRIQNSHKPEIIGDITTKRVPEARD